MADEHGDSPYGGAAARADLPPQPSKRSFLNVLLGAWAAAFAASVIYPVFRYLIPPRLAGPTTASVKLPFKASEVKINSGMIFKFGQKPGILIRTEQGEFKALSAVCTHLDCTVQYKSDSQQIWCACHNGLYDLRGRNISGPPPRPLEEFQVNEEGDALVVSKAG